MNNIIEKDTQKENPKVVLAYRLHPELWRRPFAEIENGLLQYKEAINEIAMFDESLNRRTLMPLDEVKQVAEILRQRIIDFKKAGIAKVGINIYDDIGVRNFDGGYTFNFRPITGHDGKETWWCPCPNDENLHAFFLQKLSIYAATNPDFIWIDDDYRNAKKVGIKYSCFCPDCVARFGKAPDREQLVAQLNDPSNQLLRKQWITFMNDTMNDLAIKIKKAVKEINPAIEIGFMTIGYDSTYAYDFPSWMKSMEAVKARPGHGYYHESNPRLIVKKIFDVGRQVRDYPAITTDIQYELENWTYSTLEKSVQMELNESLLSLMAGCTGIAYNAIYANEWEEKIRMLKAIGQQKPLWEKVNELKGNMPLLGVWPVDHPNLMAIQKVGKEGWFQEDYNIQNPNELAEMGVPFCFDPKHSVVALLSGKLVDGFSDEELMKLLSGGVYMDTEALQIIWQRGMGELTGVKLNPALIQGVEVLTNHSINGKETGDGRRPVWVVSGQTLAPQNGKVQELSKLVTLKGEDKGVCLTAYENQLGGRSAVAGYYPWKDFGRHGKRNQMLNLMNWLSKDRIPVRINSFARILPMIRMSEDRDRFLASFFNTSLDNLQNVNIEVQSNAKKILLLTSDGEIEINISRKGELISFDIEEIKPWDVVMVYGQ